MLTRAELHTCCSQKLESSPSAPETATGERRRRHGPSSEQQYGHRRTTEGKFGVYTVQAGDYFLYSRPHAGITVDTLASSF
ncbi:hypothetical protein DAI22_02g042750 [Oryza sativa Japonica Group]|nr:hypothetical protein DAI22_02g042750 [Oryza sativa Japonica Group]